MIKSISCEFHMNDGKVFTAEFNKDRHEMLEYLARVDPVPFEIVHEGKIVILMPQNISFVTILREEK